MSYRNNPYGGHGGKASGFFSRRYRRSQSILNFFLHMLLTIRMLLRTVFLDPDQELRFLKFSKFSRRQESKTILYSLFHRYDTRPIFPPFRLIVVVSRQSLCLRPCVNPYLCLIVRSQSSQSNQFVFSQKAEFQQSKSIQEESEQSTSSPRLLEFDLKTTVSA